MITDASSAACVPPVPVGLFPSTPLDDEERAALTVTTPFRHDATTIRWSGKQWVSVDLAGSAYGAGDACGLAAVDIDPETRWFILAPKHGRPSKSWRMTPTGWTCEASYSAGKWFNLHQTDVVEGVHGLLSLFMSLATLAMFLVVGVPVRTIDPRRGYRRVTRPTAPDGSVGAWIAPHPIGRRALILDLDDVPAPAWMPPYPSKVDLERAIRDVIHSRLPACFANAACAYHWSSSAGVCAWDATLSLHVAFWLSRPLCAAAQYEWVKSWGRLTDRSVCLPGQPIYTAMPDFVGGPDPMLAQGLQRVGMLDGDPEVVPPTAFYVAETALSRIPLAAGPAWQAHVVDRERAARASAAAVRASGAHQIETYTGDPRGLAERVQRYADAALHNACSRIRQAAQGVAGGRHDTALREATGVAALAEFVSGGERRIRDEILDAFLAVAGSARAQEGARLLTAAFSNARRVTREDILGRLEVK